MSASAPARVLFLFIAEGHHVFHSFPAAAALARKGGAEIWTATSNDDQRRQIARLSRAYGVSFKDIALAAPPWMRPLAGVNSDFRDAKIPRLFHHRRVLNRFDAIVTAERTSTVLRRFGVRRPLLIHIPHGAGDRAVGFEPRIALFDHVLLHTPKNEPRMLRQGLVRPGHYDVCGYAKFEAVEALHPQPRRFFGNDRETVLYNPHFNARLGSWRRMGPTLAEAILERTDFNLILAPHVRLMRRAPAEEQARWAARHEDRLLIDPGSDASYDMSYVRAADIYLGDVSSQVYEFIARPRPCVFIAPDGESRPDEADYAFHVFGEVAGTAEDAVEKLRRAGARHPGFRGAQQHAAETGFGKDHRQAGNCMADGILAALARARAG